MLLGLDLLPSQRLLMRLGLLLLERLGMLLGRGLLLLEHRFSAAAVLPAQT